MKRWILRLVVMGAAVSGLFVAIWWFRPATQLPPGEVALLTVDLKRIGPAGRGGGGPERLLRPWSVTEGRLTLEAGERLPEGTRAVVVITEGPEPGRAAVHYRILGQIPEAIAFDWELRGATGRQAFVKLANGRLRLIEGIPVPLLHQRSGGWWVSIWRYHGSVLPPAAAQEPD